MRTEKEEVVVLDDGAIMRNGRVAEDDDPTAISLLQDEEQADESPPLKLSDVLPWSGGVTHPSIHPEKIQAILSAPAGEDPKRSARLEAMKKQMLKDTEEKE